MEWIGIMLGQLTALVCNAGNLTVECYVKQDALVVVWLLNQVAHGTLFQKDNARPHITLSNSQQGRQNRLDLLACWHASAFSYVISLVPHWEWVAPDTTVGIPAYFVQKLNAAVDLVWQAVAQVTINGLIEGMPLCLVTCIASHWDHINFLLHVLSF